jgi:hypothetical protein
MFVRMGTRGPADLVAAVGAKGLSIPGRPGNLGCRRSRTVAAHEMRQQYPTVRASARYSCSSPGLTAHGCEPTTWKAVTNVQDGAMRDPGVCFVIEKLRLAGYASFWLVIATGIVLTKYFSDVDIDHAVMTQVFGYPNICVYFDHPPSNYVLPFLWAVTLVPLLGYIAAQWMHMRVEVSQNGLSRRTYRLLSAMKTFEAATLIAFSTIFAVSPEGWDRTLYIHTVPFFLVQLGMVSLAISNTVHGIRSGYWRRLDLPIWFTRGAIVYCLIFAMIVAFKIPYATNAMLGGPWWSNTSGIIRVASIVDALFLIFVAAVPMAKALYLVLFRGTDLDVVSLTPNIQSAA